MFDSNAVVAKNNSGNHVGRIVCEHAYECKVLLETAFSLNAMVEACFVWIKEETVIMTNNEK